MIIGAIQTKPVNGSTAGPVYESNPPPLTPELNDVTFHQQSLARGLSY